MKYTIGIIPDGHRRYAKKKGIFLTDAYLLGIKKARMFLKFSQETNKVSHVYFYTLSLENIKRRSKEELDLLYKLLKKEANNFVKTEENVRIKIIGRTEVLPGDVRKVLEKLEEKTEDADGVKVALAIAYSGYAEIEDAVKKLLNNNFRSLEDGFLYKYLYAPDFPPPDLIVRTSGERRISGFLTYQCAYSEFIFYPKLWPEMETEDFNSILKDFEGRERRFGK